MRSNAHTATLAALVALMLCLAPPIAAAADQSLEPSELASVEGITEYRLSNGLHFLLFPDQGKQQITVNITYLVGSRHEGYGETGMAHLLEHLLFKGTPNHPDIRRNCPSAARSPTAPPGSTAPTTSRPSRPTRTTSPGHSTSKRIGWSIPSSQRTISTPR